MLRLLFTAGGFIADLSFALYGTGSSSVLGGVGLASIGLLLLTYVPVLDALANRLAGYDLPAVLEWPGDAAVGERSA